MRGSRFPGNRKKARLALRNGFREDMIEAILAAQHPIMGKVAKARFRDLERRPPLPAPTTNPKISSTLFP